MDPYENLEARKIAQQGMGEDKGVARSGDVFLDSSTASVGPKCDNTSCLQREGLGGVKFKRCGGCKKMYYCSQHCQVSTAAFLKQTPVHRLHWSVCINSVLFLVCSFQFYA